jgi:stearoyl-CoA desaturase (delta-9 desaturase)
MTSAPAAGASAVVGTPTTRPVSWGRRARIAFDLMPLVGVHLALVAIPFVHFSWLSVLLIFVVTRISGLGVTAGLHRYFSHHSFKTSRWFQFLLGAAGCTALQKGPLWWVAHHRLHHKHSDKEHDPHSPVRNGFLHGHIGWVFSQDLMTPDPKLTRDLARFPELVWLDKCWMLPGVLLAAACYLIDGWSGVVWGYCASTVLVFQMTFAVNSVGHLFGKQRFDTGDGSRNNFFLGVFGLGDGWHNNHHRAPASARHGFAWYEFDMTYTVIKLWRRLGLVWGVKVPPPEVLRGEERRKPTRTGNPTPDPTTELVA